MAMVKNYKVALEVVPFTALDVNDEQRDAQHQTDAAHHDVGHPQERVLAPEQRGCGNYHGLGPVKSCHTVG